MLSQQQRKFIRSLHQKKFRQESGMFIVEGDKLVQELLQSEWKTELVAGTEAWLKEHWIKKTTIPFYVVNEKELQAISQMATPNQVLAVVHIPVIQAMQADNHADIILALDAIQDPGNVGTIIRLADWFGIETVFCGEGTADAYNSKTVQASMGSIFRVHILYGNLSSLLIQASHTEHIIYGTVLDGNNLYAVNLKIPAIIVMGNESQGISRNVAALLQERITIPASQNKARAESLNVSLAAAIVCAEFRRRFPGTIQNGN